MGEPTPPRPRIPARYRLALAAKGLLLASMMALFFSLTFTLALGEARPLLARLLFTPPLLIITVFLAWTAALAWADVLLGQARVEHGAVPLPTRRSGISMRLPNGRPAEYIFHNPWKQLQQGHRYTVTLGRFSRVMVAEPVDEGVSPPEANSRT